MDNIRILRLLVYTGPRHEVEKLVAKSIQGTQTYGISGEMISIQAFTIDSFPEIISAPEVKETLGIEDLISDAEYDSRNAAEHQRADARAAMRWLKTTFAAEPKPLPDDEGWITDDAVLAKYHAKELEQCSRFTNSDISVRSMKNAAAFLRELALRPASPPRAADAAEVEHIHAPCPTCGCEVRGQGGYLQCECPARAAHPAPDTDKRAAEALAPKGLT